MSASSAFLAALAALSSVVALAQEPTGEFSPLQKVITLVQEMKAQVEKEGEEDTMAYEKYSCWCKTTDKEKTEAIKAATARLEELTAFLSEAAATEGELKTQIEGLAADIQLDTEALAKATSVREEEKAAFDAAEADMSETIDILKQAVEILSKVQLLQKSGKAVSSSPEVKNAAAALVQLKDVVKQRFPQFEDVMKRDLFDVLGSFDAPAFLPRRSTALQQQDPSGLSGAAAGAKSYNSRSGSIFGVLQEMLDEFERDLTEAREQEANAVAMFTKLKETKEGEIAAATEQKKAKETELADLQQQVSNAKRDNAKLTDAKAADEELLANLKKDCATEAQEYEDRTKIRNEEIAALGEALKILTEDDARDLFGKTMSFIQVDAATQARRMDRAAEHAMQRIARIAKKHNSWALASLAVRTRLDAFTKVKEAMDKMTAELKAQQQEEYEKKDACEKALDEAEDELKVKKQEESDLADKHQSLTNTLETLSNQIAQLEDDVASMKVDLKAAGETRKEENKVFQQAISDQRAAINILNKALARLKAFYSPDAAVLAQVHAHRQRQEPGAPIAQAPPKPKDYEKSAGAGGVLQMFAMVIKDAETEEIKIEKSEQDAQTMYAGFAKDTTATIEAKMAAIADAEQQVAEAEGAKSETEEAQMANKEAIEGAVALLQAHHTDCDWLLKYYDMRQKARAEEMDAIADAKAILSGSDFGKEPPAEA